MKKSELITLWKVAKSFWIGGILFWLLETIVFLIIDGWHIKPINPIEIYLDKIVSEMWRFALYLTVFTSINFLIKLNK